MEDALNALERNKGDVSEIFGQIVSNTETRFDTIRLAINAIAIAGSKPHILKKTAHIGKYVRLVLNIVEQRRHLEHFNKVEWRALVEFLINVYASQKEILTKPEFVKAAYEIFRSLACLISVREVCAPELFESLSATCQDFYEFTGRKETSLHAYLMKCVRVLTELGFDRSQSLGNEICRMGRVRSPVLAQEIFKFASLVPQPLGALLDQAPQLIESYEIEFLPSKELDLPVFRPSGDADLAKFSSAIALSMSHPDDEVSESVEPSPKRLKPNHTVRYDGLSLMAKCFQNDLLDDHLNALEYIHNQNGSRQSSVCSGDSRRTSVTPRTERDPWSSFSLNGVHSGNNGRNTPRSEVSREDAAAYFWAFVLLGKSVRKLNKAQQLSLWDTCIEYLQHPGCSSGACFCLSRLTSELIRPECIDATVVERLESLLNSMGRSSHPTLSSGSLTLYSHLYSVKILNDKFQKFKVGQLSQWVQARIRDGQPLLLTQLLTVECPPSYLQTEEWEDLVSAAYYRQNKYVRNRIDVQDTSNVYSQSADVTANSESAVFPDHRDDRSSFSNVTAPLISAIPQIEASTLRDHIWMLAISARAKHGLPTSAPIPTDAFTQEDLRAIVWFANIASFLRWGEQYCKRVLSLAHWDIPAKEYRGVATAVLLLQRPGPLITAILAGHPAPREIADAPGTELRSLEPFLQSYTYQRSTWFLANVIKTLSDNMFKGVMEARQLTKFLSRLVTSQSEVSSLRIQLGRSQLLAGEELAQLIKSSSDDVNLSIIYQYPTNKEPLNLAASDLFPHFKNSTQRLTIAIAMYEADWVSLSELLVEVADMNLGEEQLQRLSYLFGFHGDKNWMIANAAINIWLECRRDFAIDGEIPSYLRPLKKLGANKSIFDRIDHIEAEFSRHDDPGRSEHRLNGFVEQIMRDCSYSGSDKECAFCIETAFSYLQANENRPPAKLILSFFQCACALLVSISEKSQANSLTKSVIERLLRSSLEEQVQNKEMLLELIPFLEASELSEISSEVYRRVALSSGPDNKSAGAKIVLSLGDLKPEGIQTVVQIATESNLENSYEYWKIIIKSAISTVEKVGVDKAYDACKANVSASSVLSLILWTNFLKISLSLEWLAFLGRLASQHNVVDTRVEMSATTSKYGFILDKPYASGLSGIKAALDNLYYKLPFHKKWKLHQFINRAPSDAFAGAEITIPEDIFPQNFWLSEIETRPRNSSSLYDQDLDSVGSLTETALSYLGLPSMGPNVLQEVPELVEDVAPCIVAACYSSPAVTSSPDQVKAKSSLEQQLQTCLKGTAQLRDLALKIIQRCYEGTQKVPVPLRDAALSCDASVARQEGFTDTVSLGIFLVELIWNNNPQMALEKDLIECLSRFYERMPDSSFKRAVKTDNIARQSLLDDVREDDHVDVWKKLEFAAIEDEVLASDSAAVAASFQTVGLWHVATRLSQESGYYDLERAWWLHEWDSVQPLIRSNEDPYSLFKGPEYGALIAYFKGSTSKNECYAELSRTNLKMATVFDHMFTPLRLDGDSFMIGTREDEIVRRGRELSLKQQNDVIGLASELKESCEHYRVIGDNQRAFQYAVKLEKLAFAFVDGSDSQEITRKILAWSRLETSKVNWELGRHSEAIAKLQMLIRPSSGFAEYVDLAEVYSMLGTWSRAARNEPDNVVLRSYFENAAKHVSPINGEYVHHAFARFSDEACHDESLDSALRDSSRLIESEKKQVEYLSQAIQDGNTEKTFQSRYRVSLRMLKSETEDYEELKKRKHELTLRCIENYMLSLHHGDKYEEDMGRFIALWLELCESKDVNTVVLKYVEGKYAIPVRKFLPWVNQLSSRLSSEDVHGFQKALQSIMTEAVMNYPHHSLWQLINILRTKSKNDQVSSDRRAAAKRIVSLAANKRKARSPRGQVSTQQLSPVTMSSSSSSSSSPSSASSPTSSQSQLSPMARASAVLHMVEFADKMAYLGAQSVQSEDSKTVALKSFGSSVAQWWTNRLIKMQVPVPTATIPIDDCSRIPYITSVNTEVVIAGGISAPKIVTLIDSEGQTHKMVLKGSQKDDLRQDAIMQQVFQIADQLFARNRRRYGLKREKQNGLRVRTYNVIPLGGMSGAIEFVRNTRSLQEILEPLHTLYGGQNEYSIRKARHVMHSKRDYNRAIRIAAFEDVMAHTPPQMRHFWTKRFRDPRDWLEAKTAWCRSTAVMSILGYIVGLGDRHCSNLLVDTTTGEVVHIDLGIAFDQGKLLYIPETVPFRLTRDMVDGMGVHGTDGVFTSAAETTLQVMREKKDRIMTVLEVLKHDALYTWRLPALRLNRVQFSNQTPTEGLAPEPPKLETGQAEHALRGVKQKLTADLSCEAMVRDLIAQARDTGNLALIFSGWSPFY